MQRRVRWAVAVGVLVAHLTLLWLAAPRRPPPPAPSAASPALTVHLLRRPAPERAPDPAPARTDRPDRLRAPPPLAVPRIELQPQAITPAVTDGVADAMVGHAAGHAAGPAPAPSSDPARARAPALDLRLPPPALRGGAAPRPPPQPRPQSVESRLAQALEAGPLREEALVDGRLRLRQGTRCVELREARAARLDPFNQSVSPTPRQAEECRH